MGVIGVLALLFAAAFVLSQVSYPTGEPQRIKHFQSKLTDAIGESNETQHWLISAVDARYLSSDQARALFQLTNQIGAMLQTMIHRAEEFCIDPTSAKLREPSSEFYIITDEPSPFRSNPDEPPNTKH